MKLNEYYLKLAELYVELAEKTGDKKYLDKAIELVKKAEGCSPCIEAKSKGLKEILKVLRKIE